MGIIKFVGRLIGYIIIAPLFLAFAAAFGLPFILAILIAESWDDTEFRDARVFFFTFILAIAQNAVLLYIAHEVFLK